MATITTQPRGRSDGLTAGARGVANFIGPLLIVAVVWEVVAVTGLVNERLLPSFTAVMRAGAELLGEGEILTNLAITMYRALVGLAIGASLGVAFGIAMARIPLLRRLFYPLVALTYALPKTAIIPVVFLWVGVGSLANIIVVVLGSFVPMVISALHGAERVPENYIWSAQAAGASPMRILWSVVIPGAMPQILNGMRMALAFAVVVTISGEMVASYTGIGRFIFFFGESGGYAFMFAAILFTITAAFILDRILLAVSARVLVWTDAQEKSRG